MSAAHATLPHTRAPAVAPGRGARPRLRVVPAPAQARTRVPFVMLCMSVLATALLGALLLNTSMAKGEYSRLDLQTRLAQSTQAQQKMLGELDRAASPANLAESARGLGMLPATGGYLRLSDGAVLGSPSPAGGSG